jgi:hypothetical protein
MGGRHTYDSVLPGVPKGQFVTAVTTSVPCHVQQDASHLGFSESGSCSPS